MSSGSEEFCIADFWIVKLKNLKVLKRSPDLPNNVNKGHCLAETGRSPYKIKLETVVDGCVFCFPFYPLEC